MKVGQKLHNASIIRIGRGGILEIEILKTLLSRVIIVITF